MGFIWPVWKKEERAVLLPRVEQKQCEVKDRRVDSCTGLVQLSLRSTAEATRAVAKESSEVNRITCNPELRIADTWSLHCLNPDSSVHGHFPLEDFCFWPRRELKHYRGRAFTTAAIVVHNAPWVILFTLTQHICFLWGSFYFCAIFTQWCYH